MMSQLDIEYMKISLWLNMSLQDMGLVLLTLSCSNDLHHTSCKSLLMLLNKFLEDKLLMLSTLLHRNSPRGMVNKPFTL